MYNAVPINKIVTFPGALPYKKDKGGGGGARRLRGGTNSKQHIITCRILFTAPYATKNRKSSRCEHFEAQHLKHFLAGPEREESIPCIRPVRLTFELNSQASAGGKTLVS